MPRAASYAARDTYAVWYPTRVTAREIQAKALKLDIEDRARLAERLLASLEQPSQAEIERMWTEEIQRRLVAMDADPSRLIPGEEVLREVEQMLERDAVARRKQRLADSKHKKRQAIARRKAG